METRLQRAFFPSLTRMLRSGIRIRQGKKTICFYMSMAYSNKPFQIHPALNEASYVMGERVESVYFFKMSSQPQLVALAIANDFISIPVVTMAKLVIPDRIVYPNGFKIKVTNSKGVRVSDVFAAMNKECVLLIYSIAVFNDSDPRSNTKVDHPHYGIMTKWELLGDHR
jgi:hypothetical protein